MVWVKRKTHLSMRPGRHCGSCSLSNLKKCLNLYAFTYNWVEACISWWIIRLVAKDKKAESQFEYHWTFKNQSKCKYGTFAFFWNVCLKYICISHICMFSLLSLLITKYSVEASFAVIVCLYCTNITCILYLLVLCKSAKTNWQNNYNIGSCYSFVYLLVTFCGVL